MKASIVIPTCGSRVNYLKDLLLAVQNQCFPAKDYEILVIDNRPEGNGAAIVEECNRDGGHPIRYIQESAIGLHHARHAGAREACGEIVVYLDDDVILGSEWLQALLEPFHDARVACSGGKIILKLEVEPPEWFAHFSDFYGSLDLGDEVLELKSNQWVYGGNMAVRKKVIFEVGGFQPDGFADRRLVWLRGEGEIGFLKMLFERGDKVIYEPRARVYHRIPASRLTPQSFYWRGFMEGISNSYLRARTLRNRRFLILHLLLYSPYCFIQSGYMYMRALVNPQYRVRMKVTAISWFSQGLHQIYTAMSGKLRQHVLQDSYL